MFDYVVLVGWMGVVWFVVVCVVFYVWGIGVVECCLYLCIRVEVVIYLFV